MDPDPRPAARLPIVVGVTGHRDVVLEPKDSTLHPPREAIEKELRTLLEDFPHSPIVVLSGLAEGADTIAAEVTLALAKDPRYRGSDGQPRIALAAALPMPLDVCALDFRDSNHVAVVERLRARAVRTIEVWRPHDVSLAGLDPRTQRPTLDRHYGRLGDYLARNCHLLIALWNGWPMRPDGEGGTADVVARFEGGTQPSSSSSLAPPANPLRIPDGLRCIRIPCERLSIAGSAPHDFVRAEHEKKAADAVLRQIDEFNEDIIRAETSGPTPESDVSRSFEGEATPGRACVAGYLGAQRAADRLALTFKVSRRSAIRRLFDLAAVALIAFEVFSHGPHGISGNFVLLLGYVGAFGLSVALIERAARRRLEAKFLVYRSFSEALRVQCVWRGVGMQDRADDAYDVLHRDAIAWVRQGLKGLHVIADGAPRPDVGDAVAFRWARTRWIADQIDYFRGEVSRTHAALRRGKEWARGLVVSGLALALGYAVVLAAGGGFASEHEGRAHDVHGGLIIAMVLLVAAGGFCRAWIARMAYEATIDRYRAVGEVFERAARAVDVALAAGDLDVARSLVQALGREALAENVGWVLLHRDHPLEIVAGG